jgi:hypothetical protein
MSDSTGLLGAAMYQPYPGGDQPPQQYGQSAQSAQPAMAAPPSVARAVQLMYIGAAASLVGIIVDLLARHSLRSYLADHATRNGKALTATQVTNTYHVELAALVVAGLIGVGLWIWMARSCQAGKNWARITSTVFFAIETISALTAVAGAGGAGAGRFYGILVWLIGLAVIILLWQRASSAYFKRPPQY